MRAVSVNLVGPSGEPLGGWTTYSDGTHVAQEFHEPEPIHLTPPDTEATVDSDHPTETQEQPMTDDTTTQPDDPQHDPAPSQADMPSVVQPEPAVTQDEPVATAQEAVEPASDNAAPPAEEAPGDGESEKAKADRRGRNDLDADVFAAINAAEDAEPGSSIGLTPQKISNLILEAKGGKESGAKRPSAGAIHNTLKRWEEIGYATLQEKPVAFGGFTEDAATRGLTAMRDEWRAARKTQRAQRPKGEPTPESAPSQTVSAMGGDVPGIAPGPTGNASEYQVPAGGDTSGEAVASEEDGAS